MKKLTLTFLTIWVLGTSNIVWSADLQKGGAALKKGDFATALREFKPLAKQGYASAQNNLGVMYDKGQGVAQNYKTAVKWYRLAAKQGLAQAQYNLGAMYYEGQGVAQNYKTAVKWYRLAAKQGYASAQNNLGLMYRKGQGVIQDYVYAHMWANIAASNGSKEGSKLRGILKQLMTSVQIEKAQNLARECIRNKYQGC